MCVCACVCACACVRSHDTYNASTYYISWFHNSESSSDHTRLLEMSSTLFYLIYRTWRVFKFVYRHAHTHISMWSPFGSWKIKSSESISVTQLSLLFKPRTTCSLIYYLTSQFNVSSRSPYIHAHRIQRLLQRLPSFGFYDCRLRTYYLKLFVLSITARRDTRHARCCIAPSYAHLLTNGYE